MKSPGRIVLYWERIGSVFWHIVLDLNNKGYYIDKGNLSHMAFLAVTQVHAHEHFHHFCDVCRHLFDCVYDKNIEEALAVAWSYHEVIEKRSDGRSVFATIYTPLYRELIQRLFDYRAPGYRDWVGFQTKFDFSQGVISYLGPKDTHFLETSRIDVAGILMAVKESLLESGCGVNEVMQP
jgi:hypothetical protein